MVADLLVREASLPGRPDQLPRSRASRRPCAVPPRRPDPAGALVAGVAGWPSAVPPRAARILLRRRPDSGGGSRMRRGSGGRRPPHTAAPDPGIAAALRRSSPTA
jgi:hypothetical protein